MKSAFKLFILLSAALLSLSSCVEKAGDEGDGQGTPSRLEGLDVRSECGAVTATTAHISYEIMGETPMLEQLTFKLKYSLSDAFPKENTKTVILDRKQTEVVLRTLDVGREYFYEIFVELYGSVYFADEGSFETDDVQVTFMPYVASHKSVLISGQVLGYSEDDKDDLSVFVALADPAFPVEGGETLTEPELDEDGKFSVEVKGLDIDTEYTYWSRLVVGESSPVEGSKTIVRTLDPYRSAEKQISAPAQDLSENGTANCYILPVSGTYKFKLTKGNSDESVGDVSSVRVLWESFGTDVSPEPLELISATCKDGDYALVQVPEPYKEGNAVVAAYNADGTILWSWHLWLTGNQIVEIEYANEAGIMMDRNLGATSADINSVGALGLFYQWGRKDPFLGASSVLSSKYALSTRNLKVVTNTAETASIAYAIANPHKFILGNEALNWLSEKDNSLWTKDKTIYDPCPVGWRLPEGGYNESLGEQGLEDGIWSVAGISRYGATAFVPGEEGYIGKVFRTPFCTPETWYPAAGNIDSRTGALDQLGLDGKYQSTTSFGGNSNEVTGLLFNYMPGHQAHYIYCGGERFVRAGGFSARCCKQ